MTLLAFCTLLMLGLVCGSEVDRLTIIGSASRSLPVTPHRPETRGHLPPQKQPVGNTFNRPP
jgi:hypothetical protein